jgi:hypothetical protein
MPRFLDAQHQLAEDRVVLLPKGRHEVLHGRPGRGGNVLGQSDQRVVLLAVGDGIEFQHRTSALGSEVGEPDP